MENIFFYDTSIGKIYIIDNGKEITAMGIEDKADCNGKNICETELIKTAANQLNEYLKGKRKDFDLPLKPEGTEFQKKVWQELCNIPYGETRSYKQVAEAVGNSKASRAVGMANNRNPILIFVPCHRVIGSNGDLVGYGAGVDIKEKLLLLEDAIN